MQTDNIDIYLKNKVGEPNEIGKLIKEQEDIIENLLNLITDSKPFMIHKYMCAHGQSNGLKPCDCGLKIITKKLNEIKVPLRIFPSLTD